MDGNISPDNRIRSVRKIHAAICGCDVMIVQFGREYLVKLDNIDIFNS